MNQGNGHDGSRLTGGGLLARNAYINLIGQVVPILVAIFAIPFLIKLLGSERFGVLALAWVIMGYFGLFDFGLGRATTKVVSERYARNDIDSLPDLIWTSVVVQLALGLLGGAILALLTPWLTQGVLNIPEVLLRETRISFYLLAGSIPLILSAAALRGVLEAVQRFDLVNLVKIPASLLNYLGPLVVLYFVRGLVAVIAFLVVSRALVLIAYLFLCLRVTPQLSYRFRFAPDSIKPLLGFGGWLTISSFIGPSFVAIDRFTIGALISLSAVTLYTTPYEAVTKLTVFPASLLAVLFPAFSAMAVNRMHDIRRLYLRAVKYLLVLVTPIVGMLLALAYELLSFWVTPQFALESAPVAQWLAIGILVNVLSHVPVTVLQGLGRADIVAKLLLIQLPLYVVAIWYAVSVAGIVGAAVAWTLQMALATVALFVAANRLLPVAADREAEEHFSWTSAIVLCGFLLLLWGVGSLLVETVVLKVFVVSVLLAMLIFWEWSVLLKRADRKIFVSVIKARKLSPKKTG